METFIKPVVTRVGDHSVSTKRLNTITEQYLTEVLEPGGGQRFHKLGGIRRAMLNAAQLHRDTVEELKQHVREAA